MKVQKIAFNKLNNHKQTQHTTNLKLLKKTQHLQTKSKL